ncbi:MAG: hypothetical protein GX139_04745 [Armatimonadetes bacterium]|nr:hypothetical protein [Armatimonadota bacterium]
MRAAWVILLVVAIFITAMTAAYAAKGKMETTKMVGKTDFVLENDYVKWVVAADGLNQSFIDKTTGKDYLKKEAASKFAVVKKADKYYQASRVSQANGEITIDFADSGVSAVFKVESKKNYATVEVVSVTGEGVQELTFGYVELNLSGDPSEPFGCCSLGLNLQTRAVDIPGPCGRLKVMCYPRFGFAGAKVAVVACPMDKFRPIMQQVVTDATDMPKSPLGGPWALDSEIARGSYLFNFDGITEASVDQWIEVTKLLGVNQIDFHGGSSFRFGDCRPNPGLYPNGRASLKAVIDRLHAAGIKAGLHPYAFFMDKTCDWVTPVPDPRLGKDATFTLSQDISAESTDVPVVESTENMSTITGFFTRNSVTLMVDQELIIYSDISKTSPYAFTKCTRGAHGTKISAHAKGAKVHHLTECFGYIAPDGDSTLLAEVAQSVADTYNECGFDMIYLDALDGEDVLGGPGNGWHYGAKFVWELAKRLDKPSLMEMSTFHPHLWCVRSRIGAMDFPTRSQKRFIDLHCHGVPGHEHAFGNVAAVRMMLPAQLGWWTLHTAGDIQVERSFPDDIEYLMCRCLATNTGFAIMAINPSTIKSVPLYASLAPIFKNYEELRHANYFPESVRKKLDKPGAEFTLDKDADDKWQLYPVKYDKRKVTEADASWISGNPYQEQQPRIRIEALMSAAPYDSPDAVTLIDFDKLDEFDDRSAKEGVAAELEVSELHKKEGVSGKFYAWSTLDKPNGSWVKIGRKFEPSLNLGDKQAIGVWVYGDGKGQLLNLQVMSPPHLAWGIGDHYIKVDFTGWKYFELIEPEAGNIQDYFWPYSLTVYGIYREKVNYGSVGSVSLWYNNLPQYDQAECYLSPVKALPLVKGKLINPKVTINGETITFPVELDSYSYLEFTSMSDCKVYGPTGDVIAEVQPQGEAPTLKSGANRVKFACETEPGVSARAHVTVITRNSDPLR